MARVAPFKQIYSELEQYIATNKVVPYLKFDEDPAIPEELRNRQFLFNTGVGANQKKQKVGVIMVVEQHGPHQVPFISMHSVIDKKDMRMSIQRFGSGNLLADSSIDVMLNAIKAFINK